MQVYREMVKPGGEAQPQQAANDTPPEPPFGIYTCASDKCGYLYVHDDEGWFYVYDTDSHPREPLKWGIQNRMTWAQFQEEGGDCTSRPLRPVRPDK